MAPYCDDPKGLVTMTSAATDDAGAVRLVQLSWRTAWGLEMSMIMPQHRWYRAPKVLHHQKQQQLVGIALQDRQTAPQPGTWKRRPLPQQLCAATSTINYGEAKEVALRRGRSFSKEYFCRDTLSFFSLFEVSFKARSTILLERANNEV